MTDKRKDELIKWFVNNYQVNIFSKSEALGMDSPDAINTIAVDYTDNFKLDKKETIYLKSLIWRDK